MRFHIPEKLNYYIDEGQHVMTLAFINFEPDPKTCSCSCARQVRLTFVDESTPRSLTQDAAAASFCMDEHAYEFLEFLHSWLRDDLEDLVDEHGDVDLEALIGRHGVIVIRHTGGRNSAKHPHPFSKVVGIRPHAGGGTAPAANLN